jgi:hypothetical protein
VILSPLVFPGLPILLMVIQEHTSADGSTGLELLLCILSIGMSLHVPVKHLSVHLIMFFGETHQLIREELKNYECKKF